MWDDFTAIGLIGSDPPYSRPMIGQTARAGMHIELVRCPPDRRDRPVYRSPSIPANNYHQQWNDCTARVGAAQNSSNDNIFITPLDRSWLRMEVAAKSEICSSVMLP